MSSRSRLRPFLEQLEDRFVPATVKLFSGQLFVSNPTVMGGKASLTLTATGTNKFQVKDGAAILGQYDVGGRLFITGSLANDSITVNLAGNTFAGDLFINGQNGNDTINIIGNATATTLGAASGTLSGNIQLFHQYGNDSIGLNTTPLSTLTVGGSVIATSVTNAFNTFQMGNASATTAVGGAMTLYGFSDRLGTPAVQIGDGAQIAVPGGVRGDSIGGRLSVTNVGGNNFTVRLGAVMSADTTSFQGVTVGGLYVLGGSGSDTVTFLGANLNRDLNNDSITPGLGTTINGDTNVQFIGDGNDFFNVQGALPSNVVGGEETVFNGNVNYTAGNGNDSIQLAGGPFNNSVGTRITGNLNINLGNGNNSFGDSRVFNQQVAGMVSGNQGLDYNVSFVDGNLNLTTGNGHNRMDAFGLVVSGNEAFHFGNGDNGTDTTTVQIPVGNTSATMPAVYQVPILIRRPSAGKLTVTFGNGNDALQLATPQLTTTNPALLPVDVPVNNVFNVNVQFGNGADTFAAGALPGQAFVTPPPLPLSGPPGFVFSGFGLPVTDYLDQGGVLMGTVQAGNNPNNVFIQDASKWTLAPNFTLAGFP